MGPPPEEDVEKASLPTLADEADQPAARTDGKGFPAVPAGLVVSQAGDYLLLAFSKTPEHPDDPLCIPVRRKSEITLLAALLTMLTALPLSLYLFGYCAGPFVWSPLSEAYGRRPFFLVYGVFFSLFTGVCAAAPTYGALLVLRFLSGFFGVIAMNNSGAVCGDLWPPKERGTAMAFYSLATFAGPALGPIVGSFAAIRINWHWAFIIPAILSGATFFAVLIALPETYSPVILSRVAKRLRTQTGDERFRSGLELAEMESRSKPRAERIKAEAWRLLGTPLIMIAAEPIVTLTALFMACVYGLIYLLFEAYPIIFGEVHGLGPGYSSLPFLSTFIGAAVSVPISLLYQKQYIKTVKKAGRHEPEMRLPPAFTGGLCCVVSFLWLGWGGYKPSVHWIVPTLSGVWQGVGGVLTFRATQTYTIDAYEKYAASAMAATVVTRSVAGGVFPIFAPALFHRLGVQWACTLLAGLMLLLVPVPLVFMRYGAWLRRNSRYAPEKQL
ncbi:hypothetical protein JCM10207_003143 [Rhodosporidiobolus poonsookiae]